MKQEIVNYIKGDNHFQIWQLKLATIGTVKSKDFNSLASIFYKLSLNLGNSINSSKLNKTSEEGTALNTCVSATPSALDTSVRLRQSLKMGEIAHSHAL